MLVTRDLPFHSALLTVACLLPQKSAAMPVDIGLQPGA